MIAHSQAQEFLEGHGLVRGLALEEMMTRLLVYNRMGDSGQRGLAFYLAELAETRLHVQLGYSSVAHFARYRLGLDKRRTSELVAVGRKLRTLPAIDRAFCEGRIGWSKLLCVVRVASPEHEQAWLKLALDLPYPELRNEARLAKQGGPPCDPKTRKGISEVYHDLDATLTGVTWQKLELAQLKLSAECGRPIDTAELLDELAGLFLQLEADGTVPGRQHVPSSIYHILMRPEDPDDPHGPWVLESELGPVPIESGCDHDAEDIAPVDEGDESARRDAIDRQTPPWMRAAVLARDGFRCRGCGSRKNLHVHHIEYRMDGGLTVVWNLITQCKQCHSHVHKGLLVLEGKRAEDVRFFDNKGRPLHEPGKLVDPALLLKLDPPKLDTDPEVQSPCPTTIDDVPEIIDGAWWHRHAELIEVKTGGRVVFTPGFPAPEDEGVQETRAKEPEGEDPFAGLVGQDALVEHLRETAEASRKRETAFPHTLFTGPQGTGKTTLARGVAQAFGTKLHSTVGSTLKDSDALAPLLAGMAEGDMLFIDEVHATPPAVLETLYEALADGFFSVTLRSGSKARCVRLRLPKFTVLAATTEEGDLHPALRSRFGLRKSLGFYDEQDLASLAAREAESEQVTLEPEAGWQLADHARGTPREAKRLVDRVLDEAARTNATVIDEAMVEVVLEKLGFDDEGLLPDEARCLEVLRESLAPVPGQRLASLLGVSERTLTHTIEPYLFRKGVIRMTPRGREAVEAIRWENGGVVMSSAVHRRLTMWPLSKTDHG